MNQALIFHKMHGIGNDFVLIDSRHQTFEVTTEFIRNLASRKTSVGFDQLIVLDVSTDNRCDAAYRFYNPDGSQAEQCGNGQRCISLYLHQLTPTKTKFCLSGLAGLMHSIVHKNKQVTVNMGSVRFSKVVAINNTKCYEVDFANPHLIVTVNDVNACDLLALNHKFSLPYPDGINFEIVTVHSRNHINLRVCERGVGETNACGSGACASVAALQRANILDNRVKVMLPGGDLVVEYKPSNNNLYLTGAAVHVFTGELSL